MFASPPRADRPATAATTALFGLALAIGARAQETAPDPLPVLVLQNLAPEARREGAAVVVPFAPGEVKDLPDLHVPDTVTAWQPFGLRWPDGSLRQAICLFDASVDALGEARVPLRRGRGPASPTGDVLMPAATIEFVLRRGDAVDRIEAARVEDLEHNALRRVELRRARLAGLVIELLVTAWRDQPHAWADVAVFHSDPASPAMQFAIGELAIECRGMALVLRHPGRLAIDQRTTEEGSRTVLVRNDVLADGQGLRRTGVLVPPLRGDGGLADRTSIAACTAPLLGATTWRESGAFGAFGVVPEVPPWLRGNALRAHLASRHRAFVQGDRPAPHPFVCQPLGLGLFPGQTGDQNDFGIVKLSLVAASGLPSLLLEAEASVLQEGCRPVHFFEADATPVDPKRHPDWVVWSGRTHFHPDVSKDRLGKPVPEPPAEYHGWSGKDREHWSSNYLGAFALLTGAHWARRELENEARLYLAGETLDPRLSTSHSGAARGAGRTTLAATWMALSTGSRELLQRMRERLDRTQYPEWAGRELPADRVRPMNVCPPDPRMLLGKVPYWNPWQDSIAAVGFAACHRVTGDAKARDLAEALACNVVRHGWLVSPRDCQIAVAMRWQDGAPLSAEQLAAGDPTVVTWAHGTAFSDWAFGAVEIARVAATANGDAALAERATAIQAAMRGRRRGPPTEPPDQGGIDRFAEWDAVAWQPK